MQRLVKCLLAASFACLVCLGPQKLLAQALPTAIGPGSYFSVGGEVSAYQSDYGKQHLIGFATFADAHITWRYGVESEARFSRYNSPEDVAESTYLIGPTVAIRPGPLRPYVKFLVGDGRIVFPYKYAVGNYFTYAPGGGLDYVVSDRLAVRLIDVEYQMWPSFTFGEIHPYGISAGVSYRLNGVWRIPKYARRANF